MYGVTTLRGVFPEPVPTHRRNFVRENVKRIKQIQGVLQNSDVNAKKPPERKLLIKRSVKSMSNSSKHVLRTRAHSNPSPRSLKIPKKKLENADRPTKSDLSATEGQNPNARISHRAVQTDKPEDICSLYANGTIIYPSTKVLKATKKDNSSKYARGDSVIVNNYNNEDLSDEMQSLGINEKHNYIKENILALKSRPICSSPQDPLKGHQKGVIPKYLKERKEEQKRQNEMDPDCPPGHVLLPDEERKETLRVLRQSYADHIKELNNMPVSNDTLKQRQRKRIIEEELKKIEEGIKVFQRPKVFVKINA